MGEADGLGDGNSVGDTDGLGEGNSVGEADGLGEGNPVGDSDGLGDDVGGTGRAPSPDTRKCINCELGEMSCILIPVERTSPFW